MNSFGKIIGLFVIFFSSFSQANKSPIDLKSVSCTGFSFYTGLINVTYVNEKKFYISATRYFIVSADTATIRSFSIDGNSRLNIHLVADQNGTPMTLRLYNHSNQAELVNASVRDSLTCKTSFQF